MAKTITGYAPVIFGILILLASCGKHDPNESVDEGVVEKKTYTSHEIGWTIDIPEGWVVMSKERLKEIEKKGSDVLEEVTQEEIDTSALNYLISFSKDRVNSFQSTSEPFEEEYEGEWEESNRAGRDVILEALGKEGIRATASEISIENVGGLDFQRYETTLYSPTGEIVLKQIIYSRLINGFDIGVYVNYNNPSDKETMLRAWRGSRFETAAEPKNNAIRRISR